MADEEDLKRVAAGELDLSKSDLRNAQLRYIDFRGRNLSGVHLEQAVVENCDFRACDLSTVHITGLKADRSNFAGAIFPNVQVAISFRGANLSNAEMRSVRLQNVDFTGANLSGANFKGAHIGSDVKFDDIEFDDATNFDGVEGLRLLGRLPAFKNYIFEKGYYHRQLNNASNASQAGPSSDQATVSHPSHRLAPDRKVADVGLIASRLDAAPAEAGVMAANLAAAIFENIELQSAKRPNDPSALAFFEEQITLLGAIAAGLLKIAKELENSSTQSVSGDQQSKRQNRAARILADLSESLEEWLKVNTKKYVSHAADLGMICISSAFFAQYGAPANFAFFTAAALVGGKPLVEAAGDFLRKSDNAKSS